MKPPRELDAVLAHSPDRKREPHVPEITSSRNWSVPIDRIFSHADHRFDASFFDPKVDADVGTLEGHATERLDALATLILPGRFERVWAIDEEHGKPYLT